MEMRVGTTGREALLPNSRGTYLATVRGGGRTLRENSSVRGGAS
jgi:hypothetical protein